MSRLPSAVSCALLVLAWAGSAWAHPAVELGRQQALEARFPEALETFRLAEEGDDLTREDLVSLIEGRALVHFATENTAELERDLVQLGSLAPTHDFDEAVPPDIVEQFLQLRQSAGGRVTVAANTDDTGGSIEVTGQADNDRGELVRELRVHIRVGEGQWADAEGSLRLPLAAGQGAAYYIEAFGPGGALVAQLGSELAPETIGGTAAVGEVTYDPDPIDGTEGDDGGIPIWVWIAGGAAVAAGLTVLIVVLATGDSLTDNTQPSAPMIRSALLSF